MPKRDERLRGNGRPTGTDPVAPDLLRPDGPGMYLHWDGRRSYRTRMPAPRVLEPVAKLSFGKDRDKNLIVEGDNLQVMVSLRPQYRSAVSIAYLDPPYNTGKRDFAYSDHRFRDPNANSDDAIYVSNEDGGRHTKWLNYMAPRLHLVHELLADHGVCFVSINDIELFRLGMLMDEIFGEANRVGVIVWKQAIDNNPSLIVVEHEYILCYAKAKENLPAAWSAGSEARDWLLETFEALKEKTSPKKLAAAYKAAIKEHVARYNKEVAERGASTLVNLGRAKRYNRVDGRGPYAGEDNTHNPKPGGYVYDVRHPNGKICKKPSNGYRFPEARFKQLLAEGRIEFGPDEKQLCKVKKYVSEMTGALRSVISLDARLGTNRLKKLLPRKASSFPHPKPVELIERLIEFVGDPEALVLDPFAGSGTTGDAVVRANLPDGGNRRFLLIEEGTRENKYCRTITAPRVRAAIKHERSQAGFVFMETGRRLNREAILDLERKTIASLIAQTDVTGAVGGIARLEGHYVIGHNRRREAICLKWDGRASSTVTQGVLAEMFDEVRKLGLNKPLRVYGSTCVVGETDSFRFCQIPDEIMAALSIVEEGADDDALEAAQVTSQGKADTVGRH